jgi:glycosyltransferase involved in cell wall biosynthesis
VTVILIDGYALTDGSQWRGIGTFLTRIIAGLAERPELSVRVLAEPAAGLPRGVERVAIHRRAPRRLRRLEHDLLLPFAVAREPAGVMHSPGQHPPRRSSLPWVQTLHDVIPLSRPHPQLEAERRRWLRLGPRLRRAAAIAAVSRFSADEGIRHLGLDPRRVHVIHNGVDHAIFHPAGAPGDAMREERPYLLHVAAWGPHKGFEEATALIARLAERGLPHRLVLAGPQDGWMLRQVRAVVAGSPVRERIEVAGYVADLPSLYRGATALLMTSRCEGFGLPALEAMACGTPVVAFANSSLPEVVGEGGVLVEDGDLEAMARAVRRLAICRRAHDELAERAVAQAARFRWETAVDAYAQLLCSVAR